ncbi:SnoaL-like domain-containing protein [Halogranum rubrum]|uniref:SnoaL-like domain-containing protein n=1 Tax=Halogranum rubrum TaxID=553466 RepID=A0A1I4CQL2_9EURY|nr:nuclear transport factor 2 family protein [Halogranum rubrum]SFK82920.1 SnoaL-like domain-containing protein [Halogranum rubrum]
MSAEETVLDYYEALRRGEPLYPYFAEDDDVVKVGISDRLTGYDAIAEGLREQSKTTDEWQIDSRDLHVVERDGHAAFGDVVWMQWRATESETTQAFDSRWSGTLEVRPSGDGETGDGTGDESDDEWLFVGMHVSAPTALDD